MLTNTGTTEPPTSACFPQPKANSWMQECRKVRFKKGSFARLNTLGALITDFATVADDAWREAFL
ncbi:hypothetical protein GCM10023156_27110 [Novipirellula rosea]|uniref:Uncharacterized protein n=1 Tax=Novipirellula rosea TaxID=1031540 RepID=A0ABP8MTY8_9BACT